MTILKLKNISLAINRQAVLRNINLELQQGKITTLIGPNGGGKTSLARIVVGALAATSGEVEKNSSLKIGYMPQKIELDCTIPMRVCDFLQLSTRKISLSEINQFIAKFPRLNLAGILQKQIHEISGGQLQKVLFLRAILGKPELLVLDEPTQYMDISAVEEFYRVIDEIRNQSQCAILLISHDLLTVMQKTDFVFCVNQHVCCSGAPELVNKHPEYLALFGLENGREHSELAVYQHHHDHKH